ncbi:MAG: hypothetical protein Q7R40_18025 [Phaeospirillum sp.]|nr:hypothetical protein [Phaeospirillum sp.]
MQSAFISLTLARDIASFGMPAVSGLSPELELSYSLGDCVIGIGDSFGFMRHLPCSESMRMFPATSTDFKGYQRWRRQNGFSKKDPCDKTSETFLGLQKYAADFGIKMFLERAVSKNTLLYILALLQKLPAPFLGNQNLREIHLATERVIFDTDFGAFENGAAYLYNKGISGSRKNMIGWLLHELGHSTDEGLANGELQQAHRVLAEGDHADPSVIYALDWGYGREDRKRYIKERWKEFVAENHLIYIVAGKNFREHIRTLPPGPIQQAYQYVYDFLKNSVFGGYEY